MGRGKRGRESERKKKKEVKRKEGRKRGRRKHAFNSFPLSFYLCAVLSVRVCGSFLQITALRLCESSGATERKLVSRRRFIGAREVLNARDKGARAERNPAEQHPERAAQMRPLAVPSRSFISVDSYRRPLCLV